MNIIIRLRFFLVVYILFLWGCSSQKIIPKVQVGLPDQCHNQTNTDTITYGNEKVKIVVLTDTAKNILYALTPICRKPN